VGLTAALNYMNRLGLENIEKYEQELLGYATDRIGRIDGYRLIGTAKEKVRVLSLIPRNHRVEDVGRALDQQGIAVRAGHHCAQPSLRHFGQEATVRPSISLYNTKEEIDYLADVLKAIASESVSYNV
jgi:cysteine desulfurase / selenocysteine lyase